MTRFCGWIADGGGTNPAHWGRDDVSKLKMMDFVLKMMAFALKMVDLLKMMDFVYKMMYFVFQMMDNLTK